MFGGIKVGVDLDGHRAIELHPPEIRGKSKRDSPLLSEGRPGIPSDGGHRGQIVQPNSWPIKVEDRELCRRSRARSAGQQHEKADACDREAAQSMLRPPPEMMLVRQ